MSASDFYSSNIGEKRPNALKLPCATRSHFWCVGYCGCKALEKLGCKDVYN